MLIYTKWVDLGILCERLFKLFKDWRTINFDILTYVLEPCINYSLSFEVSSTIKGK